MARREMGGHWSSEEEWEVSAMRALKRFEEKVSKVRPTCKSHTDDKVARASAVRRKELQAIQVETN